MLGLFCDFYSIFDRKPCLIANNVDPDQTPHNVETDLDLHCLPMTLLRFRCMNGLRTSATLYLDKLTIAITNSHYRCNLHVLP